MESRECAGRGDLFNLAQALWACSCAVLFYVQSHTGKAMVIFFLKYEQRAHAHTHTHVYSAFTNELNHLIKPTKPIIHLFTSSPSWYWTWGEWKGQWLCSQAESLCWTKASTFSLDAHPLTSCTTRLLKCPPVPAHTLSRILATLLGPLLLAYCKLHQVHVLWGAVVKGNYATQSHNLPDAIFHCCQQSEGESVVLGMDLEPHLINFPAPNLHSPQFNLSTLHIPQLRLLPSS